MPAGYNPLIGGSKISTSLLLHTHLTTGLYYKSFMIIIYDHNDNTIVIYEHNDSGLYYKTMILAW